MFRTNFLHLKSNRKYANDCIKKSWRESPFGCKRANFSGSINFKTAEKPRKFLREPPSPPLQSGDQILYRLCTGVDDVTRKIRSFIVSEGWRDVHIQQYERKEKRKGVRNIGQKNGFHVAPSPTLLPIFHRPTSVMLPRPFFHLRERNRRQVLKAFWIRSFSLRVSYIPASLSPPLPHFLFPFVSILTFPLSH